MISCLGRILFKIRLCNVHYTQRRKTIPKPSFKDCSLTKASRNAISSDLILFKSNSISALCISAADNNSCTCAFSCSITSLSSTDLRGETKKKR